MTYSIINLPEFSKDTLLIGKLFKKSNKEPKKINQGK
jgi:hypothetical protein